MPGSVVPAIAPPAQRYGQEHLELAAPETRNVIVEAIRVLRIARTSTAKSRTQTILQRRNQLLTAPRICATSCASYRIKETAARLLFVACDNPRRLHSDAALAAPCGGSPVEASSGQTIRSRLYGGDRQGNNALWTIANTRMIHYAEARDYVARRTAEGKTIKEIDIAYARPRPPALPAAHRRPRRRPGSSGLT